MREARRGGERARRPLQRRERTVKVVLAQIHAQQTADKAAAHNGRTAFALHQWRGPEEHKRVEERLKVGAGQSQTLSEQMFMKPVS